VWVELSDDILSIDSAMIRVIGVVVVRMVRVIPRQTAGDEEEAEGVIQAKECLIGH